MNYSALLRNGVSLGMAFGLGALLGAHKYHCEYYLPSVWNPWLNRGDPRESSDARKRGLAFNEAYYTELRRRMAKYE
jgi:hypothetical protein